MQVIGTQTDAYSEALLGSTLIVPAPFGAALGLARASPDRLRSGSLGEHHLFPPLMSHRCRTIPSYRSGEGPLGDPDPGTLALRDRPHTAASPVGPGSR